MSRLVDLIATGKTKTLWGPAPPSISSPRDERKKASSACKAKEIRLFFLGVASARSVCGPAFAPRKRFWNEWLLKY